MIVVFHVFRSEKTGMIFKILSYESLKQTSHDFFWSETSNDFCHFGHLIGPMALPGIFKEDIVWKRLDLSLGRSFPQGSD